MTEPEYERLVEELRRHLYDFVDSHPLTRDLRAVAKRNMAYCGAEDACGSLMPEDLDCLPLPDATSIKASCDPREPKGCPTPSACSCVAPDPRDAEIARLTDLLALAKAAGGSTSRRRRRLMRIEKFDGDKAFVAVNAKYNVAQTEIVELKARLELWDNAPREPVDATIARLTASLEVAREPVHCPIGLEADHWICSAGIYDVCQDDLRVQIRRRDALLAKAREALAPFARVADVMPVTKREIRDGDDFVLWSYRYLRTITGPHIRAAQAAVAAIDEATKGGAT